MNRLVRTVCGSAVMLSLAGCSGWQSALDPKGPAAGELAWLIWFFTAVSAVVWILVMIMLTIALVRRMRPAGDPLVLDAASERRKMAVVVASLGVTVAILIGLTLLSFFANRTLAAIGSDAALTIRVTGHQWWWEVVGGALRKRPARPHPYDRQ